MKKEEKVAQLNELIEEIQQQGHCCYRDEIEINMVNNCDLAIVAQSIASEKGISPQEAKKEISSFY